MDPYRMIFVNTIYLLVLGIILFVYRLIYPQKKINLLYVLIALSIGTTISIFRPGAYESGDFNIHIYRAMDFYKNLSEGTIMPSWAPQLNATYGYPLFIFNYSLPYYLISFFHFLGFTLIDSLKIFLALNLILPAIFMFKFIEFKFKNRLAAFVGGIFYLFFPYHLIAAHFKITIGEILAYTLIPLIFLYIEKFLKDNNQKHLLVSGLIFGLVALSHLFVAIFLTPLIFFYIAMKLNKLTRAIKLFLTVSTISLIISAYQWAPVLIFRDVLYTSKFPIDIDTIYFPSFTDLLFSPWRYGLLFQGPQGEISPLIGYAQILVVIGLILSLVKAKISIGYRKEAILFVALFLISTFIMLPFTRDLWSYLPVIGSAGPHRLLIILGFLTSTIAVYFALSLKNKILVYLIIIFAIFTTILNWGQRRVIPEINDQILRTNLPESTYQGEAHFYANTKYTDPSNPWFKNIPKNRIESLDNSIMHKELQRTVTNHSYILNTNEETTISEKTLYFPGWSVYANSKEIKSFPGKSGEINFVLEKGNYEVNVSYKDVYLLKLLKLLSALTMLYIFIKIILLSKK